MNLDEPGWEELERVVQATLGALLIAASHLGLAPLVLVFRDRELATIA